MSKYAVLCVQPFYDVNDPETPDEFMPVFNDYDRAKAYRNQLNENWNIVALSEINS